MAYNFSAEKRGNLELPVLHERLTRSSLIEFFPVEVSDDGITLGISVPFKCMDDPKFEAELVDVMNYLMAEQEFQVTDLFTGESLCVDDIPALPRKIAS